MQMINALVKTQ